MANRTRYRDRSRKRAGAVVYLTHDIGTFRPRRPLGLQLRTLRVPSAATSDDASGDGDGPPVTPASSADEHALAATHKSNPVILRAALIPP